MAYDYAVLGAELASDPAALGFAGMSDADAAAALNAATISVPCDVPVLLVLNTLLERGAWPAIELLARDAKSGVAAHDNALLAAIALMRVVTSNPGGTVAMSDAGVAGVVAVQLAALVANGTIGQPDADALTAQSRVQISRAVQLGWGPAPVGTGDVHQARAA